MNCTITRLCDLDIDDRVFIVENACKANSDFQAKLIDKELTEADGWIAVVRDQGEIIGWCRTEVWHDRDSGEEWDTLEAFVREEWRRRYVCQFAATGLISARGGMMEPPYAVFSPNMIPTCRRMGIRFVLYERGRLGWQKVRD